MGEFESWKQYWEFSWFVMRKSRYILDPKNQRFLDAVVVTSAKRKVGIEKGTALWRAQLGNERRIQPIFGDNEEEIDSVEVEDPLLPKRMVPLADRAFEGRVNAKGIPCLYCSTEMETAMKEVRPWVGSYVTVSQFVVLRDLTIVDCTADLKHGSMVYFGKEPEPDKREQRVWGEINKAFSQPVTRSDDVAEYAPTQVIADAFRHSGYDGLLYGSKLGPGKSVAIFDLTAAEPANCYLYKVEEVNLKVSTAGSPHYVSKYYDTTSGRSSETEGEQQPEE